MPQLNYLKLQCFLCRKSLDDDKRQWASAHLAHDEANLVVAVPLCRDCKDRVIDASNEHLKDRRLEVSKPANQVGYDVRYMEGRVSVYARHTVWPDELFGKDEEAFLKEGVRPNSTKK